MNGKRTVVSSYARAEPIATAGLDDAAEWLGMQAERRSLSWLLAHTDDGVVWGRWDAQERRLITSGEAAQNSSAASFCPPLHTLLVQQARLFGERAELLLWKDGGGLWQARLISDQTVAFPDGRCDWKKAFDEPQMLAGTPERALSHGFTLLRDGGQGLRHAVPFRLAPQGEVRRLLVRHYLAATGPARIAASRLLGWEGEPQP